MGATIGRVFFSLYPSQKFQAFTEEGHWLRKVCLIATICHLSMTILGLALVGFQCMILNLLECLWMYSCYLTLREREVWVYMIILLILLTMNVLDLLGITDGEESVESSMQQLGQFIVLAITVLMFYFVGRASYMFRKSGGLHGGLPAGQIPLLFEDKALGYA